MKYSEMHFIVMKHWRDKNTSEQDVWAELMMNIELKVLDIDIETLYTILHVILRRQNWRGEIHWAFAHSYLKDWKILK